MDTDFIVVGAGVNGLVAAATLARAGRRGVLLERRGTIGGLAADGSRPGPLTDTGRLHPGLRAALLPDLPMRPAAAVTLADGRRLEEQPEVVTWRASLDGYRKLGAWVLGRPAPRVLQGGSAWEAMQAAVRFRLLGERDAMGLLRSAPQSAEDWLAPQIPDSALRAAVMLDGLVGTWLGPHAPGTAATLLWDALSRADQEVAGGAPALVEALAARLDGVDVRTDAAVARIEVRGGQVQGVRMEDGSTVRARCVVSTADLKTTALQLLAPEGCPPRLEADARALRSRGALGVVRLRLGAPPKARRLRLVRDPSQLERAADALKYGEVASDPPLDARFEDDGGTALVLGVPHTPRAGWTDEARRILLDRVLQTLDAHGVSVQDAELLVPPDIEAEWGCAGGHLYHGEHALDQLWVGRPSLALSGHRTPIEGLWLGSMGTHPGGGITGGPGWLCARAILGDR